MTCLFDFSLCIVFLQATQNAIALLDTTETCPFAESFYCVTELFDLICDSEVEGLVWLLRWYVTLGNKNLGRIKG